MSEIRLSRYYVVGADSLEELEEKTNTLMRDRWHPSGGITVEYRGFFKQKLRYLQVMVHSGEMRLMHEPCCFFLREE